MPKIKNIIIFIVIGAALIFGYVFFIKPNIGGSPTLSTTDAGVPDTTTGGGTTGSDNSDIASNFLTLLLSVNSIKLDDSILSSPAFTSLHDSTITLTPEGAPGRADPFSPIGTDSVAPPVINTNTTTTASTSPSTSASTSSTSSTATKSTTTNTTTTTSAANIGANTSQGAGTNTGSSVTN